ncbi:glycosyltransferase family 4 protein [Tropicimonas sp. S265A]|uniref:glycosyltransferase family 4 protein n=1 Tax=Tropicimonas sp. S265A TaxID=3415134 RepID=UPI003C7BAA84
MHAKDRPAVLIIAEAANPEWVSVPLIGWSLSQALGEVADTHLVTQIRNRDAVLRAGLIEGVDFTAIDSEAVSRPMHKIASVLRMGKGKGWTMTTAMNALSYPYFEHLVWKTFGGDIRAGRYDIVHRVTPLTPTTVSPLAAKCARAGVPFVIGPLNGGVPWPKGFDAERRREREWLSYVRGIYKALPGRRKMLRNTAAILTGSRFTQSEIPAPYSDKTHYIPENAVDPTRFSQTAAQDITGPLRAAFVGRLVPYKGADMAIEAALPLLQSGQMTYDIIGDGPMRADLEALAVQHGLKEAVRFHGQQPHDRVQDILSAANILLFPSIREFGGGVVLEAMALGVVPMIVDYAGPGELVTPDTGLTVPIGTRAEIIAALSEQLVRLRDDRTGLPQMGQAARARVEHQFTWSAKARQIAEVYAGVLGH